jgi:hypothetical protein
MSNGLPRCYDISMGMSDRIKINRAPVLTLWAAVVAERLGFDHDETVILGRTVAGLSARPPPMTSP